MHTEIMLFAIDFISCARDIILYAQHNFSPACPKYTTINGDIIVDISAEVKNKHILLAGIVISFMEFLNPIKKVVNPINIS